MPFVTLNHDGAKSISIQSHVANFKCSRLSMPAWQRNGQKIWQGEYKSDLIESIMYGIDIPKIYLGVLHSEGPRGKPLIIDGGHRTRCLTAFMANIFPWEYKKEKIFYSEITGNETRSSRVMTYEERGYFDNYQLTLVTYTDITEKQARTIFNRLQNAAPMAMADVVNSFESDLVEYLRDEMRPWLLDGRDDYKHHKGLPLKAPETNEDLYQMLSWMTIVHPEHNEHSLEENAMKNIEMGKSREGNLCFKYLRDFDESSLTEPIKNRFKRSVVSVINFLKTNPKLNNLGDMATFIYSTLYTPNFSTDQFVAFLNAVSSYKSLESESKKRFKQGQTTLAQQKKNERDTLNATYDGNLEKWIKSKAQNGMRDVNMRIRNNIVNEFCIRMPLPQEDDDMENYIEGDDLERIQ
jgi:hypothetical protein